MSGSNKAKRVRYEVFVGIDVGYLADSAMGRIADLHPGQAKTDARDAYVIADAARTMPHTLRAVGSDDDTLAGLTVLAGHDPELAAEATRLSNRLRDALLHVHPALERLLGKHIDRRGVLDVLAAAPTPAALRELGADGIATLMRTRSPRLAKTLPGQILTALDSQTLTVAGTTEFGRVIAGVAGPLAADLEARLAAHPLAKVLTSMPGVGVRTAISWLTIVGDTSAFPTAGHLATYAGLAPVTRRSGSSIRGESRSQRGNHALKSALFCQLSPVSVTPPAAPTTIANAPRETPRRRPHLPRPPPRRRHVRHAPNPHHLHPPCISRRHRRPTGGLTTDIDTPAS